MMNFYNGYHFFGMHLIWWGFWLLFFAVVLRTFTPMPRGRGRRHDEQLLGRAMLARTLTRREQYND